MSNVADLRLNGLNPLSYQGVNPYTPVPFFTKSRSPSAPTVNDWQNFTLGTIWLDQQTQVAYMLVSLARTDPITTVATWVPFASSHPNVQALQGNTGGLVYATATIPPYINIVGDGTHLTVTGNPGTNTLTISLIGSGVVETLTGDTGGAVSPTAGNINIIADQAGKNCGSTVKVSGSGSTLTLNVTDSSANTLVGNLSGNLTLSGTANSILGSNGLRALTTGSFNSFVGSAFAGDLITTGSYNTGCGAGTLDSLVSGNNNIALGYGAGGALTSNESGCLLIGSTNNNAIYGGFAGAAGFTVIGHSSPILHNYPGSTAATANGGNTFVGANAGNFTLTGSGSNSANNALGTGALQELTTGNRNDAMGAFTLRKLTTGTGNLALGHNAAYNSGANTGLTTGSYNIIIGYDSGDSMTSSESSNIYINNIGVTGESNKIRIGTYGTGTLQQDQAFIAGIVTLPNQVAFSAYQSISIANVTGNSTKYTVPFDTEVYDIQSNYNTATGVFTAPVAGIYSFNTAISMSDLTAAMVTGVLSFYINGTGPSIGYYSLFRNNPYLTMDGLSNVWRCGGGLSAYMNAGDTCVVIIDIQGGAGNTADLSVAPGIQGSCWFTGVKVA